MVSKMKTVAAVVLLTAFPVIATAQSDASKKKSKPAEASKTSGDVKKGASKKGDVKKSSIGDAGKTKGDAAAPKSMQAAVDAAQRDILAKWGKCNVLSSELAMDREILTGNYRTTSTMLGTFDFQRKDGKLLFREQYHTSQRHDLEGDPVSAEDQSTTMWGDGQFVHTLSEGTNGRALFKNKQTRTHVIVNSKATIDRMNRAYNLKLLPEEKLLGEPVYVFEAVRKLDAKKPDPRKTLRYFSKKTGILLKRVAMKENGEITSTMRIGKIDFNPKFAADHFVFVKPEGISIIDDTKE